MREIEAFDTEGGYVDRQALAGTVEHGAGQGLVACRLDAFALVYADLEQIADEALVPVGAK
jgi:hypothetical protein